MRDIIPKHFIRRGLAFLATAAAIGCSSGTEPSGIALVILPTGASISQGGSATFAATLTRTGGFTGSANLTVTGVPIGVTAVVSNVQTTSLVTTATVTLNVDGSTIPSTYTLVLHGTGTGVTEATASFELTVTKRGAIALVILPTSASIVQGGSATVAATLTRSGGFTGTVNLTVTGVPSGVTAVVSNVQTTGLVTTATVTLNVSGSTIRGSYSLVVHGTGTGVTEATAAFTLTVIEPIAPCPAGGLCEQWAVSATASSEYSPDNWSANQATGQPNVAGCGDDPRAWASASPGVDWLELVYHESVRPTEIRVHENLGVSSIVKVEVKDGAGTYHTVYTAQPASQTCPRVLTIPVTGISALVKVVRLSFDQRALNDWNEIDAVKLIGHP